MNGSKLVILIIIGILLVAGGGAAGFFYNSKMQAPSTDLIRTLSSKAIPSIIAYGEVKNISGKNLTISYKGDSISVKIADNAQVVILTPQAGSSTTQAQVKADFSKIKVGDNLNVSIKVFSDGSMEGQSVFILPSFGTTK